MNNTLSNKRDWIGAPEASLKGFGFRGGSERHTTGVVMWSDVFIHDVIRPGKEPEKLAIVLLDTQGLFDAKTSAADNSRIFALGTLISSIQIFNLNDVVQENQLEYLQMATDYAQFHTNLTKEGAKKKPFQNLMFLMRDWVHVSDHSFGSSGGKGK
jgi:atlastin